MNLPRWTVYPALAVLVAGLLTAIPHPVDPDPHAGAALSTATGSAPAPAKYERVVVLGIDGMDPEILQRVIELYPERMPNFRRLIDEGSGIHSLGTSIPPQSPVAWSNFITGQNPGGHGIFDFIHRDPMTRAPAPSTTTVEEAFDIGLPGEWKLTVGGDSGSNRSGTSFWELLRRAGVPADIWRMPANFPVEPSKGVSFPGMMTPALDSAYGECSLFTTDPMRDAALDYEKVELVREDNGKIQTWIKGPGNPFKEHDPAANANVTIYVDREANAAVIDLGTEKVILQPGQWSDFVTVTYSMLPMHAMDMGGICRFYLRSIDPEFELYVSPVNIDPMSPVTPVSEPQSAAAELAEGIGRYYTQGMAEDVNALKYGVLNDAEFMDQVELVYTERRSMMDYALDRYLENDDGGLLFFYYSTVDLACHMMWRHYDSSHPAHDDALAAESSSKWSHREGSTWKDTVHDLYLKMDPVLGELRERIGDDATLVVMSDHGFAPYRREFDLNRWLYDNGYLKLKSGKSPERSADPADHEKVYIFDGSVDWAKTRAYGMGFNGLYLNLAGREKDNPATDENESGIVQPGAEARALLTEIKEKLEAEIDGEAGLRPVLRCDIALDCYDGPRTSEAPDMLVGFNAGYGNSDAASTGRITSAVLQDNTGGTFNGSHLMAPEVVSGILISNREVREGDHRLEDLTVEILHRYGVDVPEEMAGHPVLE